MDKSDIIKNYTSDTAASIIEVFYKDLVDEEDQKLLELAFAKKINQEQLDQFFKEWDIEKYGEGRSMMLSYVMKANPQLKFSSYERPRLEGLLKYHRFHNLKLISHYTKIVKALNQEDIFPLIMKGGAMKHIRADLPRAMGDIDILIAEESQITKARQICKNLGYIEEIPDDHSIVMNLSNSKEVVLDIHRYIPFGTTSRSNCDKEFLQNLLARAKREKVFNTQALVPCFEDLLFLCMINLARNLQGKTSLPGILYSLFDFKYLSECKKNFDWNVVLQNVTKTKTYAQALLAMKFINKIIPEMLPESLINNDAINKQFTQHCENIIFHHFYFNELQKEGKKLSIKNALKGSRKFRNYLVKKPRYFLMKRVVRKSPALINIFLKLNKKTLSVVQK